MPVGNVYYYFKTKDDLVEAAIGTHASELDALIAAFDRLDDPAERLKALIRGWVGQRGLAVALISAYQGVSLLPNRATPP